MRLVNPLAGAVTSSYNLTRMHPKLDRVVPHYGTDIGGRPRGGTHHLHAPADGVVLYVRTDSYPGDTRGGYLPRLTGRQVVIDHAPIGGQTFRTYLGHLDRVSVKAGQRVSAGDRIGTQGATGNVDGAHLHLEVWIGGQTVDPVPFFRRWGIELGTGPTTPTPTTPTRKDPPVSFTNTDAARHAENVVKQTTENLRKTTPTARANALAVLGYKGKGETRDVYSYIRTTHAHAAAMRPMVESFLGALAAVAAGEQFDVDKLLDGFEQRLLAVIGEQLDVSVTIEGGRADG